MSKPLRQKSNPVTITLGLLVALTSCFVSALEPSARSQTTRRPRQPAATKTAAPQLPKLATRLAFPNLRFDRPVALDYPKGAGNRYYIVEQHTASIWSFPDERSTGKKQLFLKLPDPINRGNEEGLLGLAFHPKYQENGQFFVYYSANDQGRRRSVVSRFRGSGRWRSGRFRQRRANLGLRRRSV